MKKSTKAVTETEWSRLFELRCRAKRGEYLPPEVSELFERAMRADPKRYSAMTEAVFYATRPFGSNAKYKK